MKTQIFIIISWLNVVTLFGQQFNNDTILCKNYKVIICDNNYAPFESRNIFPKNRFKPTTTIVDSIEEQIKIQYSLAHKIYFKLSFEEQKNAKTDYSRKEFREIRRYHKKSNIDKIVKDMQTEFDKRNSGFDREYYGYIGLNSKRYIRIIFKPHKPEYVEIPGTGEAILDNISPLTFNLDTNKLFLAGWTGEKDE